MDRPLPTRCFAAFLLTLTALACGPIPAALPSSDGGDSSTPPGGGLEVGPAPSEPAVADAGAPFAGCTIAGRRMAPSTLDPTGCGICDPVRSTTDWSPLSDGLACGKGSICVAGACQHGCFIQGKVYSTAQPDPADPCHGCDPGTSTTAWTPGPDGNGCGAGFCSGGQCVVGCLVPDAGVVPSGKFEPGDDCQVCDPAKNTLDYSRVFDGNPCTTQGGTFCLGGICRAVCEIQGTLASNGARDPADPGACCNPAVDPTRWSPAFRPGPQIATPTVGTAVVLVDMNGDGVPDVVTSGQYGGSLAYVTLRTKQGTFVPAPALTFDTGIDPTCFTPSFLARDLNGDGRPDLIAFCQDPSYSPVSIFLGTPLGLAPSQTLPDVFEAQVTVGDFQRPGSADLAVVDNGGLTAPTTVTFYLDDGSGQFTKGGSEVLQWNAGATSAFDVTAAAAGPFSDPAGRDAPDDLLVGFGNGTVSLVPVLLEGAATPALSAQYEDGFVQEPIVSLAAVALEGPGSMGAVGLDAAGNVSLWFDRNGGLVQGGLTPAGFARIAAADVNGDGLPDVVGLGPVRCGGATDTVSVLINHVSAGFPSFISEASLPLLGLDCPTSLLAADLDGDGLTDLLVGDGSKPSQILLGSCP